MEDAHLVGGSVVGLAFPEGAEVPEALLWEDTALFAVFDGHGGVQTARFCERHLPVELARAGHDDLNQALSTAICRMDEMLFDPTYLSEFRSLTYPSSGTSASKNTYDRLLGHPDHIGSTAVVCCLRDSTICVGNVGDSRAVLCRGGQAVELSMDHKPTCPSEGARIRSAGGWVDLEEERVNGDLALSRAIGDLEYKMNPNLGPGEQIISGVPDITSVQRQADDEFIVIACDGVWDVMASQSVVDFVRPRLLECQGRGAGVPPRQLSSVAEELLDHCVSPALDSGDNISMILVVLEPCPPPIANMAHESDSLRGALHRPAPRQTGWWMPSEEPKERQNRRRQTWPQPQPMPLQQQQPQQQPTPLQRHQPQQQPMPLQWQQLQFQQQLLQMQQPQRPQQRQPSPEMCFL